MILFFSFSHSSKHASITEEMRKQLGITENIVRMSVGLESVEDLKADLKYALDVAVLKKKTSSNQPAICN